MHYHKCKECGTIWKHEDNCVNSKAAHTCPDCEQELPGMWPFLHADQLNPIQLEKAVLHTGEKKRASKRKKAD